MVIWITGISGAGKTTVSRLLYEHYADHANSLMLLDGDQLREVFGEKGKSGEYSRSDRLSLALKYSKLCKLLSGQNVDVIIATISMFEEVYAWNRQNLKDYFEVYLKVPKEVVIDRDAKGLYKDYLSGRSKNVAGFDLAVDEPTRPDLVINNFGQNGPSETVLAIIETISNA